MRRVADHLVARTVRDEFPENPPSTHSADRAPSGGGSVALIVCWLGPAPRWFSAFLRSCEANTAFDWLIFADWKTVDHPLPRNVRLFRATRSAFIARCLRTIGIVPRLASPEKLCDLRPHYGRMFRKELTGYDYWGFCDLDCIWGDLAAAYGTPIREGIDVVTSRKERIAGHFTVVRSGSPVEGLVNEDAGLRAALEDARHLSADEERFSDLVREASERGLIRVHWPDYLAGEDFIHYLRREGSPWTWESGRLTHGGREFAYLHFLEWKQNPEFRCSVVAGDRTDSFTISASGIAPGNR